MRSVAAKPLTNCVPMSADEKKRFIVAWLICLLFYSIEYASRSSPSVMIPELASSFGTTSVGVAAVLGTYHYTYSLMSLVAGASLDWFGAERVLPAGLFLFAVGCLMFLVSSISAGDAGRLLQGAGSQPSFTRPTRYSTFNSVVVLDRRNSARPGSGLHAH